MTTKCIVESKRVRVPDAPSIVEMFIHDCPGHSALKPITEKSITECEYLIVCYDCTNSASFQAVDSWISMFSRQTMVGLQQISGALVALHSGEGTPAVNVSLGKDKAAQYGLYFCESNGIRGTDTDIPFSYIVHEAHKEKSASMSDLVDGLE
ncbi:Small GTPase like protein [Aduncisulcus paluster]|uniref:Small GTPase like protein n=1 Tax=Aduncisulcus paluster TaxID=2918883 RepID=A0ABQ5KKD6_9EUKA|nr:Small GTPase like protein [Aduncisulcus paluster]